MRLMGKIAPVIKLSLVTALLMLALTAPVAQATSPGENGRIYFTACGESCGSDIYSVNPDGTGLENVTDVVTDPPGPPQNASDPAVSADGKRMAFAADREIWIMNTDGTGALQLTDDELVDYKPAISPDGSKIVWNHFPDLAELDHDIWVMNSDGSGQQSFYDGSAEDYYPRFTPDGQTIVMGSETGDMDVRKVPFTLVGLPFTTSTGVADDDNFQEFEPTISPDGTRVVFTRTPVFGPTLFSIYSVSINGGPTTPLFEDLSEYSLNPAYSPDGTKIIFGLAGAPMIGNADGSGSPTPLDIPDVNNLEDFDWVPKPVTPSAPSPVSTGDKDPPKTTIDKGPKGKIRSHKVKFRFSANEAGSSFRCKLDRRKFSSCASPKRYRNLKEGKHTFRVFAIDAAGNVDGSPAKRTFTIVKPRPKGSRHAR
jgi:hypothetical protein